MKSKRQSKSYVSKTLDISNSTNKKLRVRRSYDILGNIAIIDFNGTRKEELRFAKSILQKHKMVKTILAKAGAVKGRYRTRCFRHVLGERNFIADYKENGCRFRFDVRKTFFSNRLSFERARITKLVKEKENVMVFFSGIGPFAIEIAKAHRNAKVMAIEFNKYASKIAAENLKLNKVNNVKLETGDVERLAAKHRNSADRIVMPLPMRSLEFLDETVTVAKRRCMVHIYAFGEKDSAFSDVWSVIKAHSRKKGYGADIVSKRVVRPYSFSDVEVVIDYKITK